MAAIGAVTQCFSERPEVTDVVTRKECDSIWIEALALDPGEQGKQMEKVIRLQHQLRNIGRAAHCGGEEHHPASCADFNEQIGDSREVRAWLGD